MEPFAGLAVSTPEDDVLPRRFHTALRLFLEAHDYAQTSGRGLWEFALEVRYLLAARLRVNDLRRLVCAGYAEHAVETTYRRDTHRVFRRTPNLAVSERSCFALTPAGVAWARNCLQFPTERAQDGPEEDRNGSGRVRGEVPCWDADEHVLCWRTRIIKRFKQEAPAQEAVLSAFQACGWLPCATVVLGGEGEGGEKERLHDTIKNLNRSVRPHLRFRQEGSGSRVRWEAGAAASPMLPQRSPNATLDNDDGWVDNPPR